MGLTIHYNLKFNQEDPSQTINKMRQLALDLPFEEVGEIVDLTGEQCNFDARRAELRNGDEKNEALFWLLMQSAQSVNCPWAKHISRTISPTRIMAFNTWPGAGCEPANIGLCLYPDEVDWEYKPEDDQRFQAASKEGILQGFSWRKWERHCKRHYAFTRPPSAFTELRKVPTKLFGWRWGSCCKTQYASNPEYGGIPNFLRCHISIVTLLDRMATLPGLKVRVDDEGKYGPSTFSDDWQEDYEAGHKPTYRRHKGLYNPAALASKVGEWSEMISVIAGALGDANAGELQLEAPFKDFSGFEKLEFKGHNLKYLDQFLKAMKALSVHA